MAIQLAPIAGLALRYGAVALAAYVAARKIPPGRRSQPVEDILDDMPEGATLHRQPGQVNGTMQFRRSYRMGTVGPGIAVEAAGFGRIRVRRLS